MNTSQILKNIPNKDGAGYFTVHLPSLDKTLRIRHLTVNDQKIISKLSIDEGQGTFASEGDLAKISITEVNSLDPIELDVIDVRDFFVLCCALRKENYIDDFTVQYRCQKCEESFERTLEFDRLIKLASEYEAKVEDAIIKFANGEMKVRIGIPKQLDLVMLEMYYDRIAKTRDVTGAEKYVDYIICCMTNAYFKNDSDEWEEADDFATKEFLQKISFIQDIGASIEGISKLFNDIGMITAEFFYEVECPNCTNKIKSFMDTSDFFIL